MSVAAIQERQPIGKNRSEASSTLLQAFLVHLIDFQLQVKQAHWNVAGRDFRSLHLELDELADEVRMMVDSVAERMLALGVPADGRLRTVHEDSSLPEFPAGAVRDDQVVRLIFERLEWLVTTAREQQEKAAGLDPVTEDLYLGQLAQLEQRMWMYRVRLTQ